MNCISVYYISVSQMTDMFKVQVCGMPQNISHWCQLEKILFLKRFICLVEVNNNTVNYTQTIKMFMFVKFSSPTRWLLQDCHNKPVLKKSPGWWWKFDKHEHFNCLSVINCIIIRKDFIPSALMQFTLAD